MMDVIKSIDVNGDINTKDLFSLLKTKSQKSDIKIFSKLQNFNNFPDFCNYYLNQESLKNFVNLQKAIHDFSNDDETTSTFESDIDQYISFITTIILSLNLLFKTKDTLNRIMMSSKKKLNSLKIKNQIENINQENLFNLIDIFSNVSRTDFRRNSSTSTTTSNMSLLDLTPRSLRNYLSEKELEKFKFEINDEMYDSLQKTPRFELELNTIAEEQIENLSENNKIDKKDSVLTLSEYVFSDEKNTENEEKQKEKTSNRFQSLLVMINSLYKKTLINAEEKIKLKKMVIDKSIKIDNFYYDIYQNPETNKEKLAQGIKKLIE